MRMFMNAICRKNEGFDSEVNYFHVASQIKKIPCVEFEDL